jgi:diguanylate cyclase (GGDEF)-like protein
MTVHPEPFRDRLIAALRTRALRVPRAVAVGTIVGVSVAASLAALVVVALLRAEPARVILDRSLAVSVLVPLLAATPIGWLIVELLHALEREHRLVLDAVQRDELTGLPTRRRIHEAALRDLGLARRAGRPFSVALIDLDDFKATNDRHGHAVGDALLRAAADACRASVRATDLVGRWGGEEFLAVLPDTGAAAAADVMERMRASIASACAVAADGTRVGCTASIGVASLATTRPAAADADGPAAAHALEALVALADRRMYAAKAAGKDRVDAGLPTALRVSG